MPSRVTTNGDTNSRQITVRLEDRARFDRLCAHEDRNIVLQFKRLLDLWCETYGLDPVSANLISTKKKAG